MKRKTTKEENSRYVRCDLPSSAREIPGYPRYFATPTGEIYSQRRLKGTVRMKPQLYKGYWRVGLATDAQKWNGEPIHRLVLWTFGGPTPFPKAVVRHLDGNRENNHIDNLAWGTYKDNLQDALRHGTRGWGEKHPRAKLTNELVRRIKDAYVPRKRGPGGLKEAFGIVKLSEKFGIPRGTINNIIYGYQWKEV